MSTGSENGRDERYEQRLPAALVWVVLASCIVPYLFPLAGVHLFPVDADGDLVHSLLEWSSVCASLFTAILGFLYLRVRADHLVLAIALASFVSGSWDALHALASLGLIPIATGLPEFVPISSAVSRMLKALGLSIGAAFIVFRSPEDKRLGHGRLIAAGAILVVVGGFLALAINDSLPRAQFPETVVPRPWDVPALILFALNGFVLFPLLSKRVPSLLSRALLLSAVPDIVSSATMVFGSTQLYDHPFQVAHTLKLVSSIVSLAGISLYFIAAFRRERHVSDRLERAVAELRRVEDELRLKEDRFTQIVDNIREVFWLGSNGGSEMYYVSPAYEEIFGLSADRLYEKNDSFMEVVHPDDRTLFKPLLGSSTKEDFEVEFRIVRPGGEIRWLRTRGFPIRNEAGEVFRLAGITEDITEAKHADEALRKSEARNRALLEAMPDLMFLVDRRGTILDLHAKPVFPLYRPPSEFLGQTVDEVLPTVATRILEAVAAALDRDVMQILEYRFTVDGADADYEARFVRSSEDEVLTVIRDITEQKRLEKEVLDISNREQHRIGHDLHDGISQQLTGIALLCKALERKLSARDLPEAGAARQIEELVDDAIAETRRLARGLAPVQLEEGGLSAALEELANGVESRFAVTCALHCDAEITIPSHAFATHLYRIAQEAVSNAVRHGRPSSIAIEVGRRNGRMHLTVRDDGSGIARDSSKRGMGLHIMRYRARMIDASLQIEPAPGRGTIVSCEWAV